MSGLDSEIKEMFLESFEKICRMCLSLQDVLIPVSEIYFSHFNNNGALEGINIGDVFRKYCSVQIHANDSKPPNLCKPCITMVYKAYSIFEKFLESDRILNSLIIEQHNKQQDRSIVDSETEETLIDPMSNDNLPAESLVDNEEEDSAGVCEHENGTRYKQDALMLNNYKKDNMQDNFSDQIKTESDNAWFNTAYSLNTKQDASFNSIANDKEYVQNLLNNHNSSEDNKSEVIILIPENKKIDLSEMQSFINILETNVVDSDDKTCVDEAHKVDQAWDHTYSKEEEKAMKNGAKKWVRKRLLPGAKKPKNRGSVQRFSVFKCNACENTVFDDIEKVVEHIKEIHPTLKKCILCPRVLLQPEYMIIHAVAHSVFGRFMCRKCLLVFKSEEALQKHRASPQHKAPFSCDTCGKLFTLHTSWRVHNEVIHKKGARAFFQCWICGLVLKWARNYKGHLRSHKIYPSDASHLCEFCAKGFYDKSSLTKHIVSVHEKGDKSVSRSSNRVASAPRKANKSHTRSTEDEKCHHCDYCPKSFAKKANLFAHRLSHPECDHIECRFCEKVLTTLSDYKEHKRTEHSSVICDICEKGFPNIAVLRNHRSLHKGDFKCKFCYASFKTGQRRKIHEYVHTNERPHQCKFCGSGFKQRSHLDRHIECLHTKKRFVCTLCGQGCQFACTYRNHLRSHTGLKPFLCPYCPKYFRDTTIRHRHVKRDHPERFQDFLLYKKKHQDDEVRQVESQFDKVNTVFVKEEQEPMFSALLSSEGDDDDPLE